MASMSKTTQDQPLTAAAVCEDFGCDRSTLSRWVKEGFIAPTFQFPGTRGAFLFAPEEIDRVRADALARLDRKRSA